MLEKAKGKDEIGSAMDRQERGQETDRMKGGRKKIETSTSYSVVVSQKNKAKFVKAQRRMQGADQFLERTNPIDSQCNPAPINLNSNLMML